MQKMIALVLVTIKKKYAESDGMERTGITKRGFSFGVLPSVS